MQLVLEIGIIGYGLARQLLGKVVQTNYDHNKELSYFRKHDAVSNQGQSDVSIMARHIYTYTLFAVWLNGNVLASINVVVLRQTRLVPGWVTVCGRLNHLGM